MKRTLIVASCFLFVALAAQMASAAIIAGQYVPDALKNSVGASYRLVFVTAGATQGYGITPAGYDSFVQAEANLSPLFAGMGSLYNWKAIVTVNNTDGTVARYANSVVNTGDAAKDLVDIYNLGDVIVANGAADMLDGMIDMPVLYDQYAGDSGITLVWTGSNKFGGLATPPIAGLNSSYGYSEIGMAWTSNGNWLEAFKMSQDIGDVGNRVPFGAAVYGISEVLTVPVPEPSTLALWSLFTGIAGIVVWRKRRLGN